MSRDDDVELTAVPEADAAEQRRPSTPMTCPMTCRVTTRAGPTWTAPRRRTSSSSARA